MDDDEKLFLWRFINLLEYFLYWWMAIICWETYDTYVICFLSFHPALSLSNCNTMKSSFSVQSLQQDKVNNSEPTNVR